ncbi:MAG: hypothetical protein ACXV49_02275 [Halobacteriota archaeon]
MGYQHAKKVTEEGEGALRWGTRSISGGVIEVKAHKHIIMQSTLMYDLIEEVALLRADLNLLRKELGGLRAELNNPKT